jgi:hypothetical protein
MEAFGEGTPQPGEAAKRAIEETELQVHMTEQQGRLMVRVWHPTLGFTVPPGHQPVWLGIRLQVPQRGAYRITSESYHGVAGVRRLSLSGGSFRGRVGDKFQGIPGSIGGVELDNVTLTGDVDISIDLGSAAFTSATPRATPPGTPINAKVRIGSSCRLTASTSGDINIAIRPDPSLGMRVLGGANNGTVFLAVDEGVKRQVAASEYKTQDQVESSGYDGKPVRLDVRATSTRGNVNVASIPAVPLRKK